MSTMARLIMKEENTQFKLIEALIGPPSTRTLYTFAAFAFVASCQWKPLTDRSTILETALLYSPVASK